MTDHTEPDAESATTAPRPWHERSHTEWSLRSENGVKYVLMERHCDEHGRAYDGHPVYWRDVATFHNYNDANAVLRCLKTEAA